LNNGRIFRVYKRYFDKPAVEETLTLHKFSIFKIILVKQLFELRRENAADLCGLHDLHSLLE